MFPYDLTLLAAVKARPTSIADVLQTMRTIEDTCADADGLKWFNWLYSAVTGAVESRIASGGFTDTAWLAELDVQFAQLYFGALESFLSGQPTPDCWQVLFNRRGQVETARIQFALAGINAHINHDLSLALVATCQASNTVPQHGGTNYNDYTALNTTLDSLVDTAKQTLNVRLLGDALPPVSHLEDTVAAWKVSAAREAAWKNAELLWHLRDETELSSGFMAALDGLAAVTSKMLLAPVG